MTRWLKITMAALLICAAGAASASAQGSVWVALLKADMTGGACDKRLEALEPRLRQVFGFTAYHLMHEATVPLGQKYAQWVLPRKDFYIKLEPVEQGIHPTGTVLFEIYQGKKLLVSGRHRPVKERPLFINGPDYMDGKLIFLLQLLPDYNRVKN